MGLDTVELVLAFEEEFDISIPDAMACEMVDIANTTSGILKLLAEKQSAPKGNCSTAHAFYRLRQNLMSRFNKPRSMVGLDAPIGLLVPPSQEGQWKRIAESCGLGSSRASRGFPSAQLTLREVIQRGAKREWRRTDGSIDESAVFHRVREIVSEQLGMPIERLFGDTRYIQDLGAD